MHRVSIPLDFFYDLNLLISYKYGDVSITLFQPVSDDPVILNAKQVDNFKTDYKVLRNHNLAL